MRGWFPIDGTIKSGGTADEDTASVLKSKDFWTGAFFITKGRWSLCYRAQRNGDGIRVNRRHINEGNKTTQ